MNRRSFLYKSAVLGAFAQSIPASLLAAKGSSNRLLVIHTNDVHSRLDPFPDNAGRNAGRGGIKRRAALIEKLREEHDNVLLLDAGDIFQGTPYFNFFQGEPEIKLMSELGYDGGTIGNHDFDAGIDGFEKQLRHATFPFISANYDFRNTCLDGKTVPHTVFQRGKLKIGVFGLGIELFGLVPQNLYKETLYLDPIEIAKDQCRILRQEKDCDLVICLSHLGFEYRGEKISDKRLASKVEGIDLIIGGHTHTFLNKPVTVNSPSGREVLINQVGWAGLKLGIIDFEFNRLRISRKNMGTNIDL